MSNVEWPTGRVLTTEQYVKETGEARLAPLGDPPQKRCPGCGEPECNMHAPGCPRREQLVPAMAYGVRPEMDGVDQPAHYARRKMQAIEYIAANNLPWWEANVIKYVSRWDAKDGLKDLYKARSYLDMKIREVEGHERFWEKPVATERKLNGR